MTDVERIGALETVVRALLAIVENQSHRLDTHDRIVDPMIAADEAINARLTMHMEFIRRIATATGASIAPSLSEALAAGDDEMVEKHLQALDVSTMTRQ